MNYITGKLKVAYDTVQVSAKFSKRDFVIEVAGEYPQFISLQLNNDNTGLIDPYSIGDEIKVFFNLRGREWTSPQGEVKYFNTLQAWKIEGVKEANESNESPEFIPDNQSEGTLSGKEDSDLPF